MRRSVVTDQTEEEAEDDDPYIESIQILDCLEIQLGTNRLPRFSCACHKTNIAVRKAIKQSPTLARSLAALSKFASDVRKSIQSSHIFRLNKNRLRCESNTRWSSSFLMLLCFYKAYEKNCFEVNRCPVSKEKIEFFLVLLLPAYQLSLLFQQNKSHIGEVLPLVIGLINQYNTLASDSAKKPFCQRLVQCFTEKFSYELNSDVYAVAALLHVSKLSLWSKRSIGREHINRAFNALVNVCIRFETPLEPQAQQVIEHASVSNSVNAPICSSRLYDSTDNILSSFYQNNSSGSEQ